MMLAHPQRNDRTYVTSLTCSSPFVCVPFIAILILFSPLGVTQAGTYMTGCLWGLDWTLIMYLNGTRKISRLNNYIKNPQGG